MIHNATTPYSGGTHPEADGMEFSTGMILDGTFDFGAGAKSVPASVLSISAAPTPGL